MVITEFEEGNPVPTVNPFDAVNQKLHSPRESPFILSKREQVALALFSAMLSNEHFYEMPLGDQGKFAFNSADFFLKYSEDTKDKK